MRQKAKAITKYVRVPPRKVRQVAGMIRGLPVGDAELQLDSCNTKGGKLLKKTLKSAVANAETELDLREENLVVCEVRIDEGPTMKRSKPKNKGGRHPIMKRMSHFTVVVGEEEGEE